MMRHGFRGAAEIAATLEHMAAFAHLANAVPPHLFDAYHHATLGDPEVAKFLARENPGAAQAMRDRFAALHAARTLAHPAQFDPRRHRGCGMRPGCPAGVAPAAGVSGKAKRGPRR